MGLFGTFSFQEKKKEKPITLVQMAEQIFGSDKELMDEIHLFLSSCRERHLLPSRTAWQMQLDILQSVPEAQQAEMVHNSVIKGYRQMAYANEVTDNNEVTNKRIRKNEVIVKEGF